MCTSSPAEGFTGDPAVLDVPGGKTHAPPPGQSGPQNFDAGKLFGGIGSAIATTAGIAGTILGGPVGIGLRVGSGLHTAADVVDTGRRTGWNAGAMVQDKVGRTLDTFGMGKKEKLGQ